MSKYTNDFWTKVKEAKKMNKEDAKKRLSDMITKTGFTMAEMKIVLDRINN